MSRFLDMVLFGTVVGLAAVFFYKPAVKVVPLPVPVQPSNPFSGYAKIIRLYTTKGCAPCQQLKSALAKADMKGWQLEEVSSAAKAKKAGVSAFPTMIATREKADDAIFVAKTEGAKTVDELSSWLSSLDAITAKYEANVTGNKNADGTELLCDLPGTEHCHNVSSRGEGCCVQTSINHSARWQNVPALVDFQKWVQEKKLSGGAHPGLIDERIPKCCKDRGYEVVPYVQVEGGDLEILKLACKTGRMPGVTYSKSPTGRYGGGRISHMVSLPHADDKHFVVLDNNYPGAEMYEWMTPEEFKKTYAPGWCVVLLPPPPPPPPKGKK